jgi:plastocyanin
MKKFIGFFILVFALVMISGCTQSAQPAAVTTPVTTAVPTVPPTVATSVPTPVPTTEPTTVATPKSTTAIATTVATVIKTPIPVQTASTKITTIYIRNNSFVPQLLTILPGTGISWINDDATVHAIKATGNHTGMFNSGDFVKGSLVDYTFGADEGTFEFIDTYSNATGMIIVKKGELLSSITTVRPTSTA